MNDYISREDVLETLRKANIGGYITDRLLEIPAADVQPVKRGRWICTNDYETLAYDTLYYNRCSACGEESLETGDFCPNCGARMLED